MSATAEVLGVGQNEQDENEEIDLESIDASVFSYVFSKRNLIIILVLAAFAVLSHWNIASIGQYASGWNGTLLWLGIIALIAYGNSSVSFSKVWRWIVPLLFIATSFSIYENPWLNHILMYVLPVSIGVFFSLAHIKVEEELFWDFKFFEFLTKKTISPLGNLIPTIKQSRKHCASAIAPQNYAIAARVSKGLGLLLPIGLIVIFLLASADDHFGEVIVEAIDSIFGTLDWTIAAKILCIAAFALLLLSIVFSWRLAHEFIPQVAKGQVDGVISSILMIGLLVLYVTFIILQIDYVLSGSLPIDFSKAEHMVKSGFWQLFTLSILNTCLFVFLYGRTTPFTQLILRVFIFASGLILLSGCWRLGLYVYWYGLSYEKFFASYTSIFAVYIFIYLLCATFISTKKNILKFIVFSAIWFYAVASIAPIEKVIYHTNTYLHEKEDTRINLNELNALSVDIHSNVTADFDDLADRNSTTALWGNWIKTINSERCNRKWYETNLSLMMSCH